MWKIHDQKKELTFRRRPFGALRRRLIFSDHQLFFPSFFE